jgi:hypothetical protein
MGGVESQQTETNRLLTMISTKQDGLEAKFTALWHCMKTSKNCT